MFALNTKKQNKQEVEEKSLAKQGGKALGGWENWDPFVFSLTPADLFSSSPFVLMRRFSEEIDRSFGHLFSQDPPILLLGYPQSKCTSATANSRSVQNCPV